MKNKYNPKVVIEKISLNKIYKLKFLKSLKNEIKKIIQRNNKIKKE